MGAKGFCGERVRVKGQGVRVKVKKRTGDWAPVREYYSTDVLVSQVHNENWDLADQADGGDGVD
jgi:hypothetical protein